MRNNSAKLKAIINIFSTFVLGFIALFLLSDFYLNLINWDINKLSILIVFVVIISYTRLFTLKGYYKLGFHSIIITYTFLVHFGAIIAYSIEQENSFIRSNYSMRFLYMQELETASVIALFACILFVLAARKNTFKDQEVVNNPSLVSYNEKFKNSVFVIGLIIQAIGIVLLSTLLVSGVMDMSYDERNSFINSNRWYGHIIILLSYAFPMMIALLPYKKWKYGLVLFIIISLIHFSLGNRGEVLYSALVSMAVYYMKGKRINFKIILVGLTFMFAIPIIRDLREFTTVSISITKSLIELLSELGFQIASFTYTVNLIENGESYKLGGTYFYGFLDFILRKLPVLPQVSEESSYNIKYLMPQNGIGYTHIAESYINFGFLGAGIYFVILAVFLQRLERIFTERSSSPYVKLFSVLLVVEFVNLTRNSSGTLPVYLSYILLIIVLLYLFNQLNSKNYNVKIKGNI